MYGEEAISVNGAGSFSAFNAVPTVDNTRVYQRPQIDQLPAMSPYYHVEPVGETLEAYGAAFKQESEMAYSAQVASENPTVLMADIYGVGHIGPKSDVVSIIESIRQERSNQTADNIRGGPFGSAGYLIDKDRGSDIGASLDQISLGLHLSPGMGRVEPETVERNFGAKLEPAAKTAPKPISEAPKRSVELGKTFTVTPEQAAKVAPPIPTPKISLTRYNIEASDNEIGGIFMYSNGHVVEFLADKKATGSLLEITSAIFYPKDAQGNELKNEFGDRAMIQTFGALQQYAKLNGFSELRLQFTRAANSSSKTPGHVFDRTFKIK